MNTPDLDRTRRVGGVGWKESLALLGVVLSLLFVAVELRQNTRAIEAAVRNDLATASREWTLARATNPALSEVSRKWRAGEAMTAAERMMAQDFAVALLRNIENVFLQVKMGAVDESALRGYGFTMGMYGSENFRVFWGGLRNVFDPDFVTEFEARNGILPRPTS